MYQKFAQGHNVRKLIKEKLEWEPAILNVIRTVLMLVCFYSAYSLADQNSECRGSTAAGALINGVMLPAKGKNFVVYSAIAKTLGRTYVHSTVRDIVVESYKTLEQSQPKKVYKYAETGFKDGGEFKPHKTHQNGLSVDFMVPVLNSAGKSVHLPTHVLNKLGYAIEFDSDHQFEGLTIDYEALAAHIVALDTHAKQKGYSLWRVIFAPELQPFLFQTPYADYLKENITFSSKRSWVRHDEHYHVDFDIPCKS
ncbi:hypothetical protein TDB9533_03985 [Thalassocella blandensis]|nr:hypothetical protein TDB9533_03985 [Thalassocella blandensis]